MSCMFFWMTDRNSLELSIETAAWVEAENKVTEAYFARIPERAKIRTRLTELFNYKRYNGAFERAGKYFLFRNDGLQNQDILYVANHPDGVERALLDPNTLRADGYYVTDLKINYTQKRYEIGLSVENLLNTKWNQAQFDTQSRLRNESQSVSELHYTPGSPFFIKGNISILF